MRPTLDLRQDIKRFLAIVGLPLALIVGTSVLASAATKGSVKDSLSGGPKKRASLTRSHQKDGNDDRYDSEELKFLKIINKYRQDNKLSALILSDALTVASERHSQDMGRHNFFSHNTVKSSYFPAGSKSWDRMARSGYDYPNSSRAENLAAAYKTAEKAFEVWRTSPGHNRNMLNGHQRVIGIARVHVPGSKYGWYWTTDFGSEVDPTSHAPGETRPPRKSK